MVFKMEMQNKLRYQLYDDDGDDDAACTHKVALLLGDQPRPNSTPTPLKHCSVTSIVPPWSFAIVIWPTANSTDIQHLLPCHNVMFMKVWTWISLNFKPTFPVVSWVLTAFILKIPTKLNGMKPDTYHHGFSICFRIYHLEGSSKSGEPEFSWYTNYWSMVMLIYWEKHKSLIVGGNEMA